MKRQKSCGKHMGRASGNKVFASPNALEEELVLRLKHLEDNPGMR
jgi:hypothetical protein